MDMNQTARMIEWLDEERRRDKATIATLEERLAQQSELLDKLTRRLSGTESDQASIKGSYLPAGRDQEIIQQLRAEMQQMVEQVEAKRLTAEREADRRATISRDGMIRPVQEVIERIEKLERTLDNINAVRAEQDRLSAALTPLQQKIEELSRKLEEPDRRLTFLEEQRRGDARRLSELQSELPELQKQIERIPPKLDLLEEMSLRNEKRTLELQATERDRREQIQQFIDQQTLSFQQQQGRVEELAKNIGAYDQDMKNYMQRFEQWAEAYRQMKRIIDDFERIGERLERRINEVAEMQRLSEDRFRQEWNDWAADDQKRWKQFTLTNDEAWRSHDRDFESYTGQVTALAERIEPVMESLNRLWSLQRAQANLYRDQFQALLNEFDKQAVAAAAGAPTNGTPSATSTSPGLPPFGNGSANGNP